MSVNRRKYPRVSIHVPVNYTLLDAKGRIESECVGVALDVSLGGLLLESFDFVWTEDLGIGFIDMDSRVAQIKCKMAYSWKRDLGVVHTGMSFQGTEAEKLAFVAKIIRANFFRKHQKVAQGDLPLIGPDGPFSRPDTTAPGPALAGLPGKET